MFNDIRERLSKATPGPWDYELDKQELDIRPGFNPIVMIFHAVKFSAMRMIRFNHENGESDAQFIAHSPTDIQTLLQFADEANALLVKILLDGFSSSETINGINDLRNRWEGK